MKYRAFILLILTCLAFGNASCVRPRDDERLITYSVPGLAGPDCSKELLRIISQIDGVLEAIPNTTTREVSVKYNSRTTAQKNIEHAIAAGGFDVEDTPADPTAKAKLPATCQQE